VLLAGQAEGLLVDDLAVLDDDDGEAGLVEAVPEIGMRFSS
jgi:hypothetical protein